MKKGIIIALSLMLCISSAFAQGQSEKATPAKVTVNKTGLPIVNEKVTYELAAKSRHNKNFANLEFFQNLEKETNVHIEWNMSSEDGWNEKKGLLFSGELPDAFYGQNILTPVDVVKYGAQGILIPLDDLIAEYCPNVQALLKRGDYRKLLTAPDGHIYSLPNSTELGPKTHDKLFINKTWLDKLGLPVPTTLEEFEYTLEMFKSHDMNGNGRADEIPFSFLYNRKENGLFSLFGSFGQLDKLNHFIINDKGEVVFTAVTEPYKEAIEYFHDLYSKGLIDKEGFTHDFNVYIAKIKASDLAVGSFVGWSLSSAAGKNKGNFIPLAPLKGKDGKQIWNIYPSPINSKGSFAITRGCKNPEALMRWIDIHYDPEIALQVDQGLFGRTLNKNADGSYSYLPVPDGKSFTEMIHDYSPGVNGVSAVISDTTDKLHKNVNLTERAELDKFFAPYNVPAEQAFPDVYFTVDEVDQISVLETDIQSYVSQCYANWIVNGGIDAEWDSYLKKLDQMKLKKYIALYSGAYQRYRQN